MPRATEAEEAGAAAGGVRVDFEEEKVSIPLQINTLERERELVAP